MTDGPTAVVDRQLAAYNARDLDAFVSCYAADAVVEGIDGTVFARGADALRELYGGLFDSSPRLHGEVRTRIAIGDHVVDHELVSGIDAPEWPSELEAVVIYRVRGGKIARAVIVSPG